MYWCNCKYYFDFIVLCFIFFFDWIWEYYNGYLQCRVVQNDEECIVLYFCSFVGGGVELGIFFMLMFNGGEFNLILF